MVSHKWVKINDGRLELVEGDITRQDVDAIVNAANTSLLGGGGVDGAIHRAAGAQLLAETSRMGGCDTGDAKISKGYNLPARHVIHTVGPIYQRNTERAPQLLTSAYRRSLEVAEENGLETLAFPSISTGAYGYPMPDAAAIGLGVAADTMQNHPQIKLVRFVLFGHRAFDTFATALEELAESHSAIGEVENA
jgi:O-acetyl-ADP-ribose deacetylase